MTTKTVADINQYSGSSVNPLEHPEQLYELYSVPSFETGYPEIVKGKDIGSTKITVEEGDVLVCKINPRINRVWVVKHNTEYPLLASSEWIVVRNKNIDSNYLKWYFSSPTFRTLLNSQVAGIGGSLTRAQPKQVAKYSVPVPSRSEQQQVSENLDKVNELIALRKEQLAKLDRLVKSRFIELFDNCKNEVLIGDVISISRGASPRPISAFITDREDGVNWIKIGDVSENSLYITKTEEKITPEGAKKSRMVYAGDFILSNSMSFGRPYILRINGCVHDGWLIMSNFRDTFNELYLYHAIRSNDVQYQFSGKVNGATVKNLNSDLVKNTYIKVPPMELQEQFAAFVEQTDKSKLAIQQSLDKLELLKKSLMQEYFG